MERGRENNGETETMKQWSDEQMNKREWEWEQWINAEAVSKIIGWLIGESMKMETRKKGKGKERENNEYGTGTKGRGDKA